MIKISNFSLKLIILCLLVVFFSGLWAANTVGIIDLKAALSKTPFVAANEANIEGQLPEESVIEKENRELKEKIKELENNAMVSEGEKAKLLKDLEEVQTELAELRSYKLNKESATISAQQLAAYYKEMKPDAVVKIMDNLDDATVLTVLPLLDNEQTGKILSLMEPQRAALLTKILLEGQPQQD